MYAMRRKMSEQAIEEAILTGLVWFGVVVFSVALVAPFFTN
jgi:hypothetical protein